VYNVNTTSAYAARSSLVLEMQVFQLSINHPFIHSHTNTHAFSLTKSMCKYVMHVYEFSFVK